jgi:hypothetical protein
VLRRETRRGDERERVAGVDAEEQRLVRILECRQCREQLTEERLEVISRAELPQ